MQRCIDLSLFIFFLSKIVKIDFFSTIFTTRQFEFYYFTLSYRASSPLIRRIAIKNIVKSRIFIQFSFVRMFGALQSFGCKYSGSFNRNLHGGQIPYGRVSRELDSV